MEDIRDGLVTFDPTRAHLEDVVEKVKSLTTYLLGRVEDGIHAKVVDALMSKDGAVALKDGNLASFVVEVVRRAQEKDRVRDTAVLGIVLQHLFSDATKDDADLWLALARRSQKTGQLVSPFMSENLYLLMPLLLFSSPDHHYHINHHYCICARASQTRQVSQRISCCARWCSSWRSLHHGSRHPSAISRHGT